VQKLTVVEQDPAGTLDLGFPDESWREYAEHCLTHDDLVPPHPVASLL
jgi:hypothetical protein